MVQIPDYPDQLLEAAKKADADQANRTHKRFIITWAAIALVSIAASASVILSGVALTEQTHQAQQTANQAKTTSDDTVKYLRGEQGIPGVPGTNGVEGTPGLPGATGEPGTPGERGDQGPKGDSGPVGAQGPAGIAGQPGAQGTQGAAGEPGAKGATGTKGPKGDEGPQGERGPVGATGAPGPAGPSGTTSTTAAFATSENTPADVKSANAVCPEGSVVISGGFILLGPPSINITLSATANNGWLINAQETTPLATDWAIQAVALCAPS